MRIVNHGNNQYLHHIIPVSKTVDKRDLSSHKDGPEEKLASQLYQEWMHNLSKNKNKNKN